MHFASQCMYDEGMPTLQVRDVPLHIYDELVRQAERERRSLAQQTVAVLAKGIGVPVEVKAQRRELLAEIKQTMHGRGRTLSDPVKLIREDRNR